MNKWLWHPGHPELNGPGVGSWFHILFLFITFSSIFCLAYFLGCKHNCKIERYVTLIFGLFLVLLEFLKQVLYFQDKGHISLEYIPWDLCSVPMYLSLVSFFIKDINNPVKKGIDVFNIFFGFIGGIGVTLVPMTLDTPFVYRSLQTMLWHCALATYAVFMFVSREYYKMKYKEVLPAVCIFLSVSLIAVILNEALYYPLEGWIKEKNDVLNFFFLSSHFTGPKFHKYPLINKIQNPALYIISFMTIVSGLCFVICFLLKSPYLIYKKYFKKPEVYEL